MLLVVFFVMMAIKVFLLLLSHLGFNSTGFLALKKFFAMSKIECMTIGGMGAYFLFTKKELIQQYVYKTWVLLVSLLFIPLLILFTPPAIQDGIHLVYSVVFLLIILNVSGNPNSFLKLENKVYVFLGNISYSIYMYHFMLIPAVFYVLKKLGIEPSNQILTQLLTYVSVTAVSILISWLSYKYFEGWFLKLKSRFTIIKSGSN